MKKLIAALLCIMLSIQPAYAAGKNADEGVTNERIEELYIEINIKEESAKEKQEKIKSLGVEIDECIQAMTETNMELDAMEEKELSMKEEMKLRIRYLYENEEAAVNGTKEENRKTMAYDMHEYDRKKLLEYGEVISSMKEKEEELKEKSKTLEKLKKKQKKALKKLEKEIQEHMEELDMEIEKEKELERKRKEAEKLMIPTGMAEKTKQGWQYCEEDLNLIYAIVMQECGSSYDGALAVITCACNRAQSARWSYLGNDPLSQLTASGQFCYSLDEHWKKYVGGNAADHVKEAVQDALSGIRNHRYLSFRGRVIPGGVNIGGNYYFSEI